MAGSQSLYAVYTADPGGGAGLIPPRAYASGQAGGAPGVLPACAAQHGAARMPAYGVLK